jgi:GNAT superfamily N-acetyltransferase
MMSDNMVHLPDAPPISTLTFRRFRGPVDYAPLVAVHEAAQEWDRVDPLSAREGVPTVETMRQILDGVLPGSPDMLIADIDGRVVGYNHVLHRWTEETGLRVYLHLGYLVPEWRGHGIGKTMLRWCQRRIQEIAAGEQHHGPTTYATNVSSTEREADALVRQNGYSDVRRLSDMTLEPLPSMPSTALPSGLAQRPVEPAQYRAIYAAFKDAFAGNWTSKPEDEDDYLWFLDDEMSGPTFDPALYQVAWAGDEVAGLVFARIQRGVGVIPQVAVRKAWQRRGIGRALMIAALRALYDRGMSQVRIVTVADDTYGARSLYESLGFREFKQHIFYRKPFDREESLQSHGSV